MTRGPFNDAGPLVWNTDGQSILFSANRHEDWEYNPLDTEIFEVSVSDSRLRALTDRKGPDANPALSPDGTQIAYICFDDKQQSYQITGLYLMNRDGSNPRLL